MEGGNFLQGGDDDDGIADDDHDDDTSRSLVELLLVSNRLASQILVNLAQSPANRTLMYKQELRLKATDARYDQALLDEIQSRIDEKRDVVIYKRRHHGRTRAQQKALMDSGGIKAGLEQAEGQEVRRQLLCFVLHRTSFEYKRATKWLSLPRPFANPPTQPLTHPTISSRRAPNFLIQ